MGSAELKHGKMYRMSNGELGRYGGSFVTRSYFEDIGETRSVRLHQFIVAGGKRWFMDYEVPCRVACLAW